MGYEVIKSAIRRAGVILKHSKADFTSDEIRPPGSRNHVCQTTDPVIESHWDPSGEIDDLSCQHIAHTLEHQTIIARWVGRGITTGNDIELPKISLPWWRNPSPTVEKIPRYGVDLSHRCRKRNDSRR